MLFAEMSENARLSLLRVTRAAHMINLCVKDQVTSKIFNF